MGKRLTILSQNNPEELAPRGRITRLSPQRQTLTPKVVRGPRRIIFQVAGMVQLSKLFKSTLRCSRSAARLSCNFSYRAAGVRQLVR